ncbi:MAG: MATE family efflux transporter [Candidatus Babeliales bacterium]
MNKNKMRIMRENGESIREILYLWLPEMIFATMFISLPPIIDSYIIASLKSTTTYGALGMANNFIHSLLKFAEAIPVATMVIIGHHNGAQKHTECGKDLGDTFWTTIILGIMQFLAIFFGANYIFGWLGVPEKMIQIGAPFLRLKSLGILLTFVSLGFFAFMKALKNTKIPMAIQITGTGIFILFDYILVWGKFGFPQLGLTGSALATIIQYSVTIILAILYILFNKNYKKYFTKTFFCFFNFKKVLHLLNLSWPIMIDKSSIAWSYIWLSKMIAPLGKYAISSFDIIKNLERFAFLPAVAFAQIIVFLVSNRLGAKDPVGAKANIKKVMLMTSVFVSMSLIFLCYNSKFFIRLFDPKHKFTDFASPVLIIISLLVVFDFIQLILAGALRGAGDVRTVMWVRFFCCLLFFGPLSYIFSNLNIQNPVYKFALVYGSFYLNTGIIGLIYLLRIKTPKWQNKI